MSVAGHLGCASTLPARPSGTCLAGALPVGRTPPSGSFRITGSRRNPIWRYLGQGWSPAGEMVSRSTGDTGACWSCFLFFSFFFFSFFSFLLLFDSPKAYNSPLEESRNARTTDSAFLISLFLILFSGGDFYCSVSRATYSFFSLNYSASDSFQCIFSFTYCIVHLFVYSYFS